MAHPGRVGEGCEPAAAVVLSAMRCDEAMVRDRAGRSYDRSYDPRGAGRQLLAVLAHGERTPCLREVSVPTLVIHGAEDPLLDVTGGRATAEAIPGAKLVVLEGMGHDLPRDLWPVFIDRIFDLVRSVERGG